MIKYIAKEIKELNGIDESTAEELQRRANRIARDSGYGRATDVVLGDTNRVLQHIRYGYRKITTGEYVPHAYRKNYGWKNTYYQEAKTIVEIAVDQPIA